MEFRDKNYYIIDAHAHIYPDPIAPKASKAIGEFYHITVPHCGTVDRLISEGKSAGISRFLVHSVATKPHQVREINMFILSQMTAHKEFIGFMALHPDMTIEAMRDEIDFAICHGFKGIKLHPDFQQFSADDERAENIYKAVDGRLPILFHAGDKRFGFSNPKRLAVAARRHPELTLICAHFGGYSEWDDLGYYDGLENVYFDTSSSLMLLSPERALGFIKQFGAKKFFFGTDYPMWNAAEELERFFKLDLTEQERKMILSENLIKLLKL